MAYRREGSVFIAALWILLLSILLFWLPLFGSLIAGFVGGRIAGTPSRGVLAATIPAIVVALIAVVIGSVIGVPGIGVLAGAVLFVVIVIEAVPVILGAIIGGALA